VRVLRQRARAERSRCVYRSRPLKAAPRGSRPSRTYRAVDTPSPSARRARPSPPGAEGAGALIETCSAGRSLLVRRGQRRRAHASLMSLSRCRSGMRDRSRRARSSRGAHARRTVTVRSARPDASPPARRGSGRSMIMRCHRPPSPRMADHPKRGLWRAVSPPRGPQREVRYVCEAV
jgi:hypothetical protein